MAISPIANVFAQYRIKASGECENLSEDRIGYCTFESDERGYTVYQQKDSLYPLSWRINTLLMASKEAAIYKFWDVLQLMEHNLLYRVRDQLDVLQQFYAE